MPKSYKLKIILGGAHNSGKNSFINGNNNNGAPIGVSFEPIECYANDGDSYKFIVWNLKDKEPFRFMFPFFCRGAFAGLLCFDLTNRSSFTELPRWIKLFMSSAGNIPMVLVGTKKDLDEKEVSNEEINELAKEYGIERVFYSSIYDDYDIKKDILEYLVKKIDPNYPIRDFSIIPFKILEDENFMLFLENFQICPICKRDNHYETLKNVYFNKNDPNVIEIRGILEKFIINRDRMEKYDISFGIPCCNCHKVIF